MYEVLLFFPADWREEREREREGERGEMKGHQVKGGVGLTHDVCQ
jgi:hypothetical protein